MACGKQDSSVSTRSLSLFSFSMLGLVVATNIFQMYIFWELVGASSYLLIGFYYTRPSAVAASKKAFIVTRFADLGFLLGILVLSYYTGTFNFTDFTSSVVAGQENVFQVNPETAQGILAKFTQSAAPTFMGASVLTWALVLIFMGGMGKSAMMPLHIWLPRRYGRPDPRFSPHPRRHHGCGRCIPRGPSVPAFTLWRPPRSTSLLW